MQSRLRSSCFPVVLLPLAAVWTFRRRGRAELIRGLAIFGVIAAAVFAPFVAIAPHGVWESVHGELSRPLQIETLAGSFLQTFSSPRLEGTHGSFNLIGDGSLALASTVVLVGVLAALWIAFARGPADPDRLTRYFAACVCAFIVFGKVLSPQFLIWLVPLVPLVRGRRGSAAMALLAAALVNMLVWFPNRYYDFVYHGDLAWLVFTRDLTLLALFVVLAAPAPSRLSPRAAQEPVETAVDPAPAGATA